MVFCLYNLVIRYLCLYSNYSTALADRMQDYIINVTQIEELQTLNDRDALDNIFERAQRTVVGGASVVLVRQQPNGQTDKFDTITTEQDLSAYKTNIYKYLA